MYFIHSEFQNLLSALVEYCDFDIFNPHCKENEAIVIQHARFGRMRVGRCLKRNLYYYTLGCSVDALEIMDSLCSGR